VCVHVCVWGQERRGDSKPDDDERQIGQVGEGHDSQVKNLASVE